MLQYGRAVRAFFTHTSVALVAVIGTAIYDRMPWDTYSCVSDFHDLSQNDLGDEIQMRLTLCGGIAYSNDVTLEFKAKGHERGEAFFAYEGGPSDPEIIWSSDNVITVRLSDIGQISKKLDRIGRIQVHYEIGRQAQ
ncbi:hypothetical protein [Roseiarcus fermentans]|uniref:hypothetical protein n=1 Tax=Roseiarcus fermentans TaxID=1473586 RepID=UPI0011BD56D8|nr:hypothetical protein [Roseiarcus fermentans]